MRKMANATKAKVEVMEELRGRRYKVVISDGGRERYFDVPLVATQGKTPPRYSIRELRSRKELADYGTTNGTHTDAELRVDASGFRLKEGENMKDAAVRLVREYIEFERGNTPIMKRARDRVKRFLS